MDQFEAARLKNEKRLERARRYQESLNKPSEPVIQPAIVQPVPKEKPVSKEDAVIDVTVTLPTGVIELRFVKPRVVQNVPSMAKLNKNEFRNRLLEALRPLLGAVHDADRGHNKDS